MQIAQFDSYYQYDPKFERGMYLYEHHRCLNNIIGYCNSLCYRGKLQPKRGMEKGTIFPATGHLCVDSRGMKPNGGSRYNPLEAETTAAWLAVHKDDIEHHYGEPLYKVAGAVTPFSVQVNAIKTSLRKLETNGKDEQGSLTVGTVHSLQEVERAIVLLPLVYLKHEDGRFPDSNSSIFNVVVSRAKDNFSVFDDMDLIEMQPAFSLRGLLAKHLLSSNNNVSQFKSRKQQDLISTHTQISTLYGVERHDGFLNKILAGAQKKITIIFPWLSWQKVEQTGFLTSMVLVRS